MMDSRYGKRERLISINELISQAKKRGVCFGNGDPKNRLRYFVKVGLFPHAQRKSFNGRKFPEGAYPESAIEILLDIDRKLKSGKTVLEIKREAEAKKKKNFGSLAKPSFLLEKEKNFPQFYFPSRKSSFLQEKKAFITSRSYFFKIFFLVLVFLLITSFALGEINIKKPFQKFLAAISPMKSITLEGKLKKTSEDLFAENIPDKKTESFVFSDSYLTINAETLVKYKLKAESEVAAPSFSLTKEKFKGTILSRELTADRTYVFPDQSGTVCLSTGNCLGLRGEVLTSGGTTNRLSRFVAPFKLGNSSINDYFSGLAITIDNKGNVGIGTNNPVSKLDVDGDVLVRRNLITNGNLNNPNLFASGKRNGNVGIGINKPKYKLHVNGRIQATGDICTDLGGGKCLSQISNFPIFFGGGGAGVEGSGSVDYIPLWTETSKLGNSIISQSASNKITVSGAIKVNGFELPTGAHSGYILTSDDNGVASWQPAPSGTFSPGDIFLRGAFSVFRFPIEAQTNSTTFVTTSVYFSSSSWKNSFPSSYSSTTREYAFLIKLADDIPTNASSTWRVYRPANATTSFEFEIPGQHLSSLDQGFPYLTNLYQLPDDDWVLQAKVPTGGTIRIFEILLLAYDRM